MHEVFPKKVKNLRHSRGSTEFSKFEAKRLRG